MSIEWCCEHDIRQHGTTMRDVAGNMTTVLACDVCDCRQYGFTNVPDPWWKKEIEIPVWEVIAAIVVSIAFNITYGMYRADRALDRMTCVHVRHEGGTGDYVVCGEPAPVKGDFD